MNDILENKIREIGREIYSLMGHEVPSLFDRKSWNGRLTEWVMKDEPIKVRLFRFVDVLPCLKTDSMVTKVLNEYFSDLPENPFMKGIGAVSGLAPFLAAKAVRTGVQSMAAQFVAGRDEYEALKVFLKLRKQGIAFSADLLGEVVLSDKEASEYAERYEKLISRLSEETSNWHQDSTLDFDTHGPIPVFDVSLKISSFCPHIDPMDWEGSIENAIAGLSSVAIMVTKLGGSITLDMEHYYFKDLTIEILDRLLGKFPDIRFPGIALQAYLPETREDLFRVIQMAKKSGRRVLLRLVKGAYWDYETVVNRQKGWPVPVFLKKEETDSNYEDLTRILLENIEYVRPAIASHNIRSISHAIAVADSIKLPSGAFEFQMIFGMAEPIRSALKNMNFRVRSYTPIGELIPGMAYLIRRLLENTSNQSFLRKSFSDQVALDELLKPPQPVSEGEDPAILAHGFSNEPLTDFSKAENRRNMEQALEQVRKDFTKRYPLSIGGRDVWTDHNIVSVNPSKPDEVVGFVSSASIEQAENAIDAARLAWSRWRNTPVEKRAEYLFQAAEEIRKRRFELMALEMYEVGKTWSEADGDLSEAIDHLEYYAREMIRLNREDLPRHYPGENNDYYYEGRGVVALISPWNFPLAIPAGMVSAALVTGNCVIFKPSSLAPVLGWRLVDIFRSAGLPTGVLSLVPGSGYEIGELLVSHPGVDLVAFTGSMEVGLRIFNLSGRTPHRGQFNVKRVIADMGGKNAIIVDETADLDEAVKGVIESAFSFQGQKCSACSRAIVVGEAYEEFCERLKQAAKSIVIGRPENPGVFMGPVIDEGAVQKIKGYIELGEKEAKTLLVRNIDVGDGHFVGPAIFTDVSPDSRLAQEEIFGPVLVVMRTPDLDGALEIANGTPYALTGGIFSRSPANIEKAKDNFRVGNLYINRKITGALVGRQPFGGFGMSGIGYKAGGPDYLPQFMNAKSVSENTLRRGFAPSGPQDN